MIVRLRSWWQKIRQRRVAIAATTAILVVAIAMIIIGYWFDVTGFNGYTQVSTIHTLSGPMAGTVTRTEVYLPGQTLWDWMQLLAVPLALALVALLFNLTTTRTEQQIAATRYKQEQEIALDKQREDLLQVYLDRMSDLLLEKNLPTSQPNSEVRNVARVRTITILFQLNARRIGYVFAFLRESGLMSSKSDDNIVSLSVAALNRINLSQADLNRANFSRAVFSRANLSGANLTNVILLQANLSGARPTDAKISGADLSRANLSRADLDGADLSGANLKGAKITEEQLKKAKSLADATMPDGSKHS